MDLSTYQKLEDRINSLEMWDQRKKLDIKRLAAAGFRLETYTASNSPSSHLRCAFCSVPFDDWRPTDDPWVVHLENCPRCIHVLVHFGVDKVRRYLDQQNEDYTLDLNDVVAILGEFTQRSEDYNRPELFGEKGPIEFSRQSGQAEAGNAPSYTYTSPQGRPYVDPRMPGLRSLDARLRTFHALKQRLPNIDLVAEAGFYFDAPSGVFRCYHCGLTVKSPGNDPWVLHAQGSECYHVILTKGEPGLDEMRALPPADHTTDVYEMPEKRQCEEDEDEPYTGPTTRSQTKKVRTVYTQRE